MKPEMEDTMTVTVIATGFGNDENGMPKKPNSAFTLDTDKELDDISSTSTGFDPGDDYTDVLDIFNGRHLVCRPFFVLLIRFLFL